VEARLSELRLQRDVGDGAVPKHPATWIARACRGTPERVAALAPDADETSQGLLDKFPTTPVFAHIEVTDGRVWLKQSGVTHFAGDLPEAQQKLVHATQGAPVADLFNQKVEGTAWKTKPSWYVLATQDHTVHPDLQRFVSKRMKAATTEVTSSHVPMLSKPDVVLDVIRKAASAVSAR